MTRTLKPSRTCSFTSLSLTCLYASSKQSSLIRTITKDPLPAPFMILWCWLAHLSCLVLAHALTYHWVIICLLQIILSISDNNNRSLVCTFYNMTLTRTFKLFKTYSKTPLTSSCLCASNNLLCPRHWQQIHCQHI